MPGRGDHRPAAGGHRGQAPTLTLPPSRRGREHSVPLSGRGDHRGAGSHRVTNARHVEGRRCYWRLILGTPISSSVCSEGATLAGRARLSTDPQRTADEYLIALDAIFARHGLGWSDLGGVIIGSVVPVLTEIFQQLLTTAGAAPRRLGRAATRPGRAPRRGQPRRGRHRPDRQLRWRPKPTSVCRRLWWISARPPPSTR